MLKNAYLLAKIGADTAENDRDFGKNWQLPYGSSVWGPRAHRPLPVDRRRPVEERHDRGHEEKGAERRGALQGSREIRIL